jgi:adenylate cyclase class 2
VIESEIKIPVPDLTPIRHRLEQAGGRRLADALLETNILFDTADGELAGSGRVLRLRRIGDRRVMTYKDRATMNGAVKQRREIELDIGSVERMTELLGALGFAPSIRYQKWRESWHWSAIRVELDHTPMGDFVELEGDADRLEDAARRLGLEPGNAVAGSYIELWIEHRRRRPDAGRDMVFE